MPDALAGIPFTPEEAAAAGVSADRLGGPAFTHLRRGAYIDHHLQPDDELEAHAWMMLLPDDAAMYGATAAEWYELPITPSPMFQIIVPPGTVPRRRPGLEPHEGLAPDDATVHRGLRVTVPVRTWLDLSSTLSDIELVVVGDAMARRDLVTPDDLIDRSDNTRRRRGIVRARKLARLVRTRVDSPQETRLRLALVDADLPCPEVNIDISDGHGGWIGRPDLAYPDLKIAIQYEGDVHRTNKARWRADVSRDEVLREHGWEVIRVTAEDLRHPWQLRRRVLLAVERQRARLGRAA